MKIKRSLRRKYIKIAFVIYDEKNCWCFNRATFFIIKIGKCLLNYDRCKQLKVKALNKTGIFRGWFKCRLIHLRAPFNSNITSLRAFARLQRTSRSAIILHSRFKTRLSFCTNNDHQKVKLDKNDQIECTCCPQHCLYCGKYFSEPKQKEILLFLPLQIIVFLF